MKTLMQKLEDIFVAVTFAEAGELDTARQMMAETDDTLEHENLEQTCEAA